MTSASVNVVLKMGNVVGASDLMPAPLIVLLTVEVAV